MTDTLSSFNHNNTMHTSRSANQRFILKGRLSTDVSTVWLEPLWLCCCVCTRTEKKGVGAREREEEEKNVPARWQNGVTNYDLSQMRNINKYFSFNRLPNSTSFNLTGKMFIDFEQSSFVIELCSQEKRGLLLWLAGYIAILVRQPGKLRPGRLWDARTAVRMPQFFDNNVHVFIKWPSLISSRYLHAARPCHYSLQSKSCENSDEQQRAATNATH